MSSISVRTVGVVGMGMVGWELARLCLARGLDVRGVDISQARLDALRAHLVNQPEYGGRLALSCRYGDVRCCDVIIICVPTPLTDDSQPDLSSVLEAAQGISPFLAPGQLISLESSTFPGTTEGAFADALRSKMDPDSSPGIYICYSPERLNPGGNGPELRRIPKLVAGVDQESTAFARGFYSLLFEDVLSCSSPAVAELAKLFENTFRYVNIALVEELTLLCDALHLDPWEVIDAASTKPFGFLRFEPGLGPGGHCIPVDPFYMDYAARQVKLALRLLHTSREVIENVLTRWVERIQGLLEQGPARRNAHSTHDAFVLGLTYKANIADTRYSRALELVTRLRDRGIEVAAYDPLVKPLLPPGVSWSEPSPAALASAALTVVAVDHDALPYHDIATHSQVLLDTRNAFSRRGLLERVRCPVFTR